MKAWTIAWKDTAIRFRDRNALILMLAAPLLITAIIGSAFSGFIGNDDDTPISDIPFIVVNEDEGECGRAVIRIFTENEALAELLATQEMDDVAAAQEEVAQGNVRAVLHIPPDFSAQLNGGAAEEQISTMLNLHLDPAASITPNIIRGIVASIAAQFSTGVITSQVIQTTMQGLQTNMPADAATGSPPAEPGQGDFCQNIHDALDENSTGQNFAPLISLKTIVAEEEEDTTC